VDRGRLPQARDQWWALLNTIMNLGIPYAAENLLTSAACISLSTRTLIPLVLFVNNWSFDSLQQHIFGRVRTSYRRLYM
jgi:uncharacterized membrane protein